MAGLKTVAVVEAVKRNNDDSLRDITFKLENGRILAGVPGLSHKTIAKGDEVNVVIRIRTVVDTDLVESFKRIARPKSNWRHLSDQAAWNKGD